MKFIEIKEGICVRKDDIIAIEALTPMSSRIILENITYDSNFSYYAIKQLLEMDNEIENKMSEPPAVNFSGQHFAG